MKIKKRIVSLVLSFALVCTMMLAPQITAKADSRKWVKIGQTQETTSVAYKTASAISIGYIEFGAAGIIGVVACPLAGFAWTYADFVADTGLAISEVCFSKDNIKVYRTAYAYWDGTASGLNSNTPVKFTYVTKIKTKDGKWVKIKTTNQRTTLGKCYN